MDFLLHPTPEHEMLRKSLRTFVEKQVEPQARQFNAEERFNRTLFNELAALGVLGVTVPQEYGGAGMDPLAAVIVHEELSASDPGFCLAYLAHAMLCVNNIAVNASDEQKKRLLPGLCEGSLIGAMGMSEAEAGTDVLAMRCRAERRDDGQYLINGRKMWITNGAPEGCDRSCDVLLLYARSGEDDSGRAQLSTFIVERATAGFSVGQKITGKLGMRSSSTAELCFDDCLVPERNRVGKEGESLLHMMKNLEIERLTLAAMALGIARRCLEVMIQYAEQRRAFSKKLSAFGQIQAAIADSYAEFQAARAYVYATAQTLDSAGGSRMDSDGVKLFAAPVAKRIADRAIQTLGGNGYIEEYVVERLWRDAKLLEIGGGTLESHQKNIAKDFGRWIAEGKRL